MKLEIEVKRRRGSVTQGVADVYVNGEKAITFGDDIQIIKPGQPYYSEKIGGWASTIPDERFILGLLYHPYDGVYHYSDQVKEILEKEIERLQGMSWDIEVSDGIRERMKIKDGFEPFVALAVMRHMTKDWGEVEPEEKEHNDKKPLAAIGAYTFREESKVYVKAEDGHLRVFFPEEY